MNLKSLDGILAGVGKLRAASVVAYAANAAAMLGLNLPKNVQEIGMIAASVVLAGVNIADGYIRGSHAKALPALIAQGAESVAQSSSDPRVDAIAQEVETVAARVSGLENRPGAPSLQEIIAGLTGHAAPAPAPAPTPAPAASVSTASSAPAETVSTPAPATPGA